MDGTNYGRSIAHGLLLLSIGFNPDCLHKRLVVDELALE
jgi:hypothetical protein